MKATSTDRKTVQVTENEEQIGELIYGKVFSLAAEIKLANGERYTIEPTGFFGTAVTVTKAGVEVANLKMNWLGQIILAFPNDQEFALKAQGLFYNTFVIENKDGENCFGSTPNSTGVRSTTATK